MSDWLRVGLISGWLQLTLGVGLSSGWLSASGWIRVDFQHRVDFGSMSDWHRIELINPRPVTKSRGLCPTPSPCGESKTWRWGRMISNPWTAVWRIWSQSEALVFSHVNRRTNITWRNRIVYLALANEWEIWLACYKAALATHLWHRASQVSFSSSQIACLIGAPCYSGKLRSFWCGSQQPSWRVPRPAPSPADAKTARLAARTRVYRNSLRSKISLKTPLTCEYDSVIFVPRLGLSRRRGPFLQENNVFLFLFHVFWSVLSAQLADAPRKVSQFPAYPVYVAWRLMESRMKMGLELETISPSLSPLPLAREVTSVANKILGWNLVESQPFLQRTAFH